MKTLPLEVVSKPSIGSKNKAGGRFKSRQRGDYFEDLNLQSNTALGFEGIFLTTSR